MSLGVLLVASSKLLELAFLLYEDLNDRHAGNVLLKKGVDTGYRGADSSV